MLVKKQEVVMSKKIKITGKADSFAESLQNCLGEMLILFLLKQKPMYIYEISQELNRISDGSFTYKSLYPYIYRLKNAECIAEQSKKVTKNKTRTYFHITEYGLTYLTYLKGKYRDDLAQFIQENDSAEAAEIVSHFGMPQELALTYLDCASEKKKSTYSLKKNFYWNITKIILIVLSLSAIIFAFKESRKIDKVYIYETIGAQETM